MSLKGQTQKEYVAKPATPYHSFKSDEYYEINKDKEVFYVVKDECKDLFKLGKSDGSMKSRLATYADYWGKDYGVKLIRPFAKATTGSHYSLKKEDKPIKLAANYERKVLAQIKKDGKTPVRGKEYFKSYDTIKTAMQKVDKDLDKKTAFKIPNRRSPRLK